MTEAVRWGLVDTAVDGGPEDVVAVDVAEAERLARKGVGRGGCRRDQELKACGGGGTAAAAELVVDAVQMHRRCAGARGGLPSSGQGRRRWRQIRDMTEGSRDG